jgi:hypothetical protein
VFARLLDVKAIDGSFFHKQGNFPLHGFVELGEPEARGICSLEGVDFDNVRLLMHAEGVFVATCTSDDIENGKLVRAKVNAA